MNIDFTRSNRDKYTLKPIALKAYNLFVKECKKEGLDLFPTDFLRTKERQWFLYCQGRTVQQAIKGGVPSSFANQYARPNEKQVTWTLKSEHMSGLAWDMACSPPRALYDAETLKRANKVAEGLGLKHGGSYGDSCHFECPATWKEPVLDKDVDNVDKVSKIELKVNGIVKEVEVINKKGFNYVKLRDLADSKIEVLYDEKLKIPVINVK